MVMSRVIMETDPEFNSLPAGILRCMGERWLSES